MKVFNKRSMTAILVIALILISGTVVAVDHSTHYSKYWFYTEWPMDSSGVHIKWNYEPLGSADYSLQVAFAAADWMAFEYSPLEYEEVWSSDLANLIITSNNYGNTAWVGLAAPRDSIKSIQINEYYSGHNMESVTSHEMGHTNGLDHYNCSSEVMYQYYSGLYEPYIGDIAGIMDIY